MSIELQNDFRAKYKKFLDWLPYMREKYLKIAEAKPEKWKEIWDNFVAKVEAPMEEAWAKLTDQEKEIFI